MSDLSLTSRIRVNSDVLFQELQGQAVLLNLKTGKYFGLDDIGTHVWDLITKNDTLADILEKLLNEYDVAEERCRLDLLELISRMQQHGLITQL